MIVGEARLPLFKVQTTVQCNPSPNCIRAVESFDVVIQLTEFWEEVPSMGRCFRPEFLYTLGMFCYSLLVENRVELV